MPDTTAPPTGIAAGIDGCPGGWVMATLDDGTVTWRTAGVDSIADLLAPDRVTGIDMPIGLLATGERACDRAARRELPGAAARVFTTPPRPVLELGAAVPNDVAQRASRRLMGGKGVSRQALHLAPRILALDAALEVDPSRPVVEVHPEISFATLAGRVLSSKHTADGLADRATTMACWLPDVAALLEARPAGVPLSDALDALAALWSAVRWRDGLARTLPEGATARPFIVV